ncbi:hypothetical protein BD769DRAFT_1460452 [Suillus cothurnatus]|nr:hypothetical protein BD769DRAFT_1460452 [Suillus cothurnatus]
MALAVQSTPPPTFAPTPTIFPPQQNSEIHTYSSYSKERSSDLAENHNGHWTVSLDVPIPDKMAYPTLTYLDYTVKYGIMKANEQGTSTIRTRIMLTKVPASSSNAKPTSVPNGNASQFSRNEWQCGRGPFRTRLIAVPTVCLSSIPAIKESLGTSQWNNYLDQQQLLPNVRIIDHSRLYLDLYVAENPSPLVLRSLVINVSATWVEDLQGKALHDEVEVAEMRIASAEKRIAEEKQTRLQAESKSAQAILAKESAKKGEEAAKKKSKDDQLAKKRADDEATADRDAKKRAEDLAEARKTKAA